MDDALKALGAMLGSTGGLLVLMTLVEKVSPTKIPDRPTETRQPRQQIPMPPLHYPPRKNVEKWRPVLPDLVASQREWMQQTQTVDQQTSAVAIKTGPFGTWLAANLTPTWDQRDTIHVVTLISNYQAYCVLNGLTPAGTTEFLNDLRGYGDQYGVTVTRTGEIVGAKLYDAVQNSG